MRKTALPKLRNDQVHEIVEAAGNVGGLDQEPVAGIVEEPAFHLIDDLLRRAEQGTLPTCASEALVERKR